MTILATQYAAAPDWLYVAVVVGLFLTLTVATVVSLCRAAARPRPRPPGDEWAALDRAVNGGAGS